MTVEFKAMALRECLGDTFPVHMLDRCAHHNPFEGTYSELFAWADRRSESGDEQVFCETCKHWYFKDEL